MDIEELIGLLQNPGDDGLPDTIYDDLRSAHTGAVDEVHSTAQAKMSELEAAIAERDAQIEKLKADNWDLFEQIPKAGDDDQPASDPTTTDHGDDATIDDLITYEEED